jgi:hypothetical protein
MLALRLWLEENDEAEEIRRARDGLPRRRRMKLNDVFISALIILTFVAVVIGLAMVAESIVG